MLNSEVQERSIGWQDLIKFLSPAGQQQIIDFVCEARDTRGADWLPQIKAEFPFASWIIDLACNKTDEEALTEVADSYVDWPIRLVAGKWIKNLHARLKYEIEKPRNIPV